MQTVVEERSLIERLRPRLAAEEKFARAGGKIKTKSFFRRHEKRFVAPAIKAGLQALRLYEVGRQQALRPVVTEFDLYFNDLPEAFDGFRLLQLADLHIDGVDGLTEKLASLVHEIEADVCVLTGDYRFEDEGPCDEVYRCMRKLLPGIASRHGIYGILGNHDESGMAFALEEMGVRMLINEAAAIDRGRQSIWLAGIDDPFDYKCDDLPAALTSIPSGAFKILLAHTPDLYSDAADSGIHLYLCGHTHGGQVRLPKIGALRSNAKCPRDYTYRYWNHDGMHGYTSGGIGCSSLPVRLNCPPEIVLITLRRQNNPSQSSRCGNSSLD
ncbi:MAG TPA: metallophosphoesterase [Bryobacteraceae bacterium]|nr:metallophosphoesterase [Bryobacteraceae bacterium]